VLSVQTKTTKIYTVLSFFKNLHPFDFNGTSSNLLLAS